MELFCSLEGVVFESTRADCSCGSEGKLQSGEVKSVLLLAKTICGLLTAN
jgi:hypothetical protein